MYDNPKGKCLSMTSTEARVKSSRRTLIFHRLCAVEASLRNDHDFTRKQSAPYVDLPSRGAYIRAMKSTVSNMAR